MVQISDENSKPILEYKFRDSDKNPPSSPPLSKDEELRDIRHGMSIENLILRVSNVTVSYLIHYDSLLQNATNIITKCDSYFIIKCDRRFITKCVRFFITKCDFNYKLRQYKVSEKRMAYILVTASLWTKSVPFTDTWTYSKFLTKELYIRIHSYLSKFHTSETPKSYSKR